MKTQLTVCAAGLALATVAVYFASSISTAWAEEKTADQPLPVEESMHEFMEYMFEPTYKRLKAAMTSPPADKQAWKPVKSDALILAEAGNLLLLRLPADNAADWSEHSQEVRTLGDQLYQAARKGDYPAAQTAYKAMLTSCNACHDQFADGEHQLQP